MRTKYMLMGAAILVAGLAFSQATLGNVIRLGSSTTALLPTSSTTIQGGLIYNTDTGRLYVNDGTSWLRVAILLSDGGVN